MKILQDQQGIWPRDEYVGLPFFAFSQITASLQAFARMPLNFVGLFGLLGLWLSVGYDFEGSAASF